MKRYEVQGPFHRRGVKPYWIVFDRIRKHVVSSHTRKGQAWDEARTRELATKDGESA